jgi:competence protein ComEC
LRLVPAAVGAWIVAGFAIGVDPSAPPVTLVVILWSGAAALAGLVALGRPRHRGARTTLALMAVAAVAAALVATVAVSRMGERAPGELREAVASGAIVSLELTTSGTANEGRFAGVVSVARVGSVELRGSVPVLVFGERGGERFPIGTVLRLSAELVAAEPGEDVAFLVFPRGQPEVIGSPGPLLAATDELRQAFLATATDLPDPGGGLLPGLAIGDTSAVGADLDAAMKESSLSHLTAVSGANCAVVVGIAWVLVSAIGARRGIRVAGALVTLTGFVVLVTPQASVLRAGVMAGVVLLALALGRPLRGLPVLCLAVLGLLVVDPWLALDYGFALSVLATAGLLVLAGPLAAALGRVLPRSLALGLAVPIAAQLACQPVLLMLNPALPLYGVPANILAAPAAPLATILGLAACLVLPVIPGLGVALAAIAWVPASWIAAVAQFFAALPGAQSPWPIAAPGILLLVVMTALGIAGALLPPGRMRWLARAVTAVAVVGYLASVGGIRIVELASRPPNWQYAECDVGQGDATLIRSGDVVALVDTGPEPEPLRRCLDDLGIGRIDLLVLTHYDLDHVGGVDAVVGRVDRVLVGPSADAQDDRIRQSFAAAGAQVDQVARGARGSLGLFDWRVVWPPPSGVEPGNAASVTLLVTPGTACASACLSGLLLGDLGEESQARLLGAAALGPVDVVKVAHHGSADQSGRFYEVVHARVGLIGVGTDNDYGHPTANLLAILAATGTAAYRTDVDGLVLVAPGPEPGDVEVWTSRVPAPG